MPSDTSKDYYFIHRLTPSNTETVLVEYGFLDSKGDDVNQLKNNWQDYAEAVVRAIATEKGLKYTPIAGSNTYVVQRGDSLYSIARKFDTTVSELTSLNNLTSNELQIGQVLKIPQEETSNGNLQNTYTVKVGDSLYQIAQRYGTTVDELKRLNNLTSNTLSIGQQLIIPSTSPSVNYYTVQRGDSLYSIAKKFGTTVDKLKAANNMSSNLISIGQELVIPTN